MFIRLIIWGLIFYLAYKLVTNLLSTSANSKTKVEGKSRNKPLDLSDQDVEDADYEDIK